MRIPFMDHKLTQLMRAERELSSNEARTPPQYGVVVRKGPDEHAAVRIGKARAASSTTTATPTGAAEELLELCQQEGIDYPP